MWNSRRAEQFQRIAAAEEARKTDEIRREKSMAERDQRFSQHREKLQGTLKRGRITIYTKSVIRRLLFYPVTWCFSSFALECDTCHVRMLGGGGGRKIGTYVHVILQSNITKT